MMKKKNIIIVSALIIIGIFFVVGIFGISGQVTLKAGDCEKNYKHYYIEPFISDFLECMAQIPCGTAQGLTIHNTKVDVIQCLCKNIETNKETITEYYNKELSKQEPSNDVEFICKKGAKKFYRQ